MTDTVAQRFTLFIVPDADVALESNAVLTSSVELFLKELKIVVKYLNYKADMRQPLIDNGDDAVKTNRRLIILEKVLRCSLIINNESPCFYEIL